MYVVATPIGNLADLSQRAIEVLRGVDLIAAEDTRHSGRLLTQFGIDTPTVAYHDHAEQGAVDRIDRELAQGGAVALISDAGTPLISDPGYRLVRSVQDSGYAVFAVPGACAAIAALSVSGLPTDRFLFEGFLPAKAQARANRLAELSAVKASLIFYEAPHRVQECLEAMAAEFGQDREATLARELTKAFETIKRGTLAELLQLVGSDTNQRKGEIVLVVAGRRGEAAQINDETSALLKRLAEDLPAKHAAAIVADWSGLRKKLLYEHLVALKDSQ